MTYHLRTQSLPTIIIWNTEPKVVMIVTNLAICTVEIGGKPKDMWQSILCRYMMLIVDN